MNTKLTQIARTREIKTKDKNSAGERVENIFYSKYYETPPYIGIYRRFFHAFIDSIICFLVYFVFAFIILLFINIFIQLNGKGFFNSDSNTSDIFLVLIIFFSYFINSFLYYLFFELIFGRTIGHMISGAIILDEFGQKPSLKKVFIRTISRYVPLDFISAFENRAWHDQWSDTLVLHKKKYDEFKLRLEIEGIVL
jgi:uncharacterized RDD family membrane protein YckC